MGVFATTQHSLFCPSPPACVSCRSCRSCPCRVVSCRLCRWGMCVGGGGGGGGPGICFDFQKNGTCSRGDACRFTHEAGPKAAEDGADKAAAPVAAEGERRGPRAEGSRPLYSVPFMFQAREFLRTKLVGKKVQVVVEFIKPKDGKFPEKTCVTISVNGENIATSLIRKGLASTLRYRDDDDNRADNYIELLQAEDDAANAKAGIHSITEKSPAGFGSQPVSSGNANVLGYEGKGWVPAVVEYVVSGSRMRIYIPKDTCIATVMLGGINTPRTAMRNSDKEDDPFSNEATDFTKDMCMQRDIQFKAERSDKNGNFIGQVSCNGVNLAVALVEEGLSDLHQYASNNELFAELTAAEEKAKAEKKNMWEAYDAAAAAADAARRAAETGEAAPPTLATGGLTGPAEWKSVTVSHVEDAITFWAQDDAGQEDLAGLMKTLNDAYATTKPVVQEEPLKKGEDGYKPFCASKFSDGQYYRCVAEGKNEDKTKIEIRYIDYGNIEIVDPKAIVALPQEVKDLKFAGQAARMKLAYLNGPAQDYADDGRDFFADGVLYKSYKCSERMYDDECMPVSLMFEEEGEEDKASTFIDIAKTMLSNGMATTNSRVRVAKFNEKHKKLTVDAYKKLEERAVTDRVGQWMYGDVTEDPKDI